MWCTVNTLFSVSGNNGGHVESTAGTEKMYDVFRIAGAVLISLEAIGAISKRPGKVLPIGGSHIAQMAIVLGLAFAISEFGAVFFR